MTQKNAFESELLEHKKIIFKLSRGVSLNSHDSAIIEDIVEKYTYGDM
jgi:hypothetical protein